MEIAIVSFESHSISKTALIFSFLINFISSEAV